MYGKYFLIFSMALRHFLLLSPGFWRSIHVACEQPRSLERADLVLLADISASQETHVDLLVNVCRILRFRGLLRHRQTILMDKLLAVNASKVGVTPNTRTDPIDIAGIRRHSFIQEP